jgi:hypothetical protein
VADVLGWELDDSAMRRIERIIATNVKDPIGPEFMAPPSRDDSALAA